MKPPPLAIRASARFQQRVAASAQEMRGRAVCSVHPAALPWNIRLRRDLIFAKEETPGTSMNKRQTTKSVQSKRKVPRPLMVAMAVAIFGVLGMLFVDHGPWNRPKLQTAEMLPSTTTGA